MAVWAKSFRLLATIGLIFTGMAVVNPANATDAPPFKANYRHVVYGDFLYAGNGVLRCPVVADHAPVSGGNTPELCSGTADRSRTGSGDDFFLRWSDVDSDPGTFDSSRASVTIPPGAKIAFARLGWAGNTGAYATAPGVVSSTKACVLRNGDATATVPPGTPREQAVRMRIGEGKSVDISPFSYAEDPLGTLTGGQYYSAYADVTSQFAGAPTGAALDMTVGNVWAPQGFGCVGGWSLTLVYAYPERNADYAPDKREVLVYDGHVRQRATDPATDVTLDGFRAAAADAHVGVTAYGGDWGAGGDRFLIDGKEVAEPATGSTSNFFIGDVDNATAPAVKNTFGVDAKSFNTDSVPAGATSVKLGFRTTGDDYLAQNVAFSIPVPALQVALKAPERTHAGDQVPFTVVVTNPGVGTATGVKIAADTFAACTKELGTLTAGQTVSYPCTAPAPDDDFKATVRATGTSSHGDPLDDTATVSVDVVHPGIGITKKADKSAYRAGDPVQFTIDVTNTGDVPLGSVKVADLKTPSCARTLPGSLAPGQHATIPCTAQAPIPDGVNTASVSAVDPLGKQLDATADAGVRTIAPAIEVAKTASAPTMHAGDPVTWTIVVRNTGDSLLAPVTLTDDTTTSCSHTFEALAAGVAQTYTCTANPPKTVTSTVTATGTDLTGRAVTAAASATVTVIHPSLTIAKVATPAQVREGDKVTFTITVGNAGDVPLDAVTVSDDRTPACSRPLGTLPPQAKVAYTCATTAPMDDFTNTATASGQDRLGRELKVTGDAPVDVVHPAVAIDQAATPGQVREGDTVTFTITVTNTGDAPLTDVAVSDDRLPACAKPLGTLAPQGKQTYTCTMVAPTSGFTNTAKVTGTDPTARPMAASADASFTVQHPAISLAQDVRGPFRPGDPVPFHFSVKNTGDVPLAGPRVSDALAADCARAFDGVLAPGETWTYDCAGKAPAGGVTNQATVTATPPVGPPVSASANAVIAVIHPAIEIAQDAAPAQAHAGDTVTFTLTVTNSGDGPLTDVSITDAVAPDCAKRLGTLAPQAKQAYTCTTVAGEDDITSTALATGTDLTARPVTASAAATVDVIHPAITITQSAAPRRARPGDTVTFTFTIKNSGDVPLIQLSIVDSQAPPCAHSIASLPPGAELRYACTITAGTDSFTNSATVTAEDPAHRQVKASADASVTVLHPGLALTKEVKGGPFREGDTVTFAITLTNTGDVPLTAVKVEDDGDCAKTFDKLDAAATQQYECTKTAPADDVVSVAKASGKPPTGAPVTATGEATVDVIHPAVKIAKDPAQHMARPGDDVTFTVTVTNTGDVALKALSVKDDQCAKQLGVLGAESVTKYTCTGKVPADDFTTVATVSGNDPTGRPVTATGAATVDVIHPELALMKDATPYLVREGDKVTFTILVKNTGDVPLTELSVVDDHTPACAHKIAALGVDAEETYTCTTVAGAQGFTNTARATGQDPTQRAVTASGDAAFVVQHPALTVSTIVHGGPFRAGDSIPFEIVVTNTGDVELDEVAVADEVAPGCKRDIGTLPVNALRRYDCTMSAPAHNVTNVAKAVGTPPVGALVSAEGRTDVQIGQPRMADRQEKAEVAGPGIRLEEVAPAKPVEPGQPAEFTVAVTNSSDLPLIGVVLNDPVAERCSVAIGPLAPGERSNPVTCDVTMRDHDITNTVTASGIQDGKAVSAIVDAVVKLAKPTFELSTTTEPGDVPTFAFILANTGNVDLTDIESIDSDLPACDRTFARLAPGERREWTCRADGKGEVSNAATVTGIPDVEQAAKPISRAKTVRAVVPARTAEPLAGTGFEVIQPVAVAISLLVSGAVMLLCGRRRSAKDAFCAKERWDVSAGTH
ncbi:MAG TPA: hypothetical protein VJX66_22715 [Amycolatopsis sp.]|nr:hypothetical protein [Amycolatopsis sp.]